MGMYHWMQSQCGGLRRSAWSPQSRVRAAAEMFDVIVASGKDPRGSTYLEVGTGHVPVLPIALWLMGADRTITLDLNRHLQPDLCLKTIGHIADQRETISQTLAHRVDLKRLEMATVFSRSIRKGAMTATELLERCGITYLAPADAASTNLPSGSVQYHVSYTVMEHVDAKVVLPILAEGRRLLCTQHGLAVHRIDYSDHFNHDDRSISPINFLKFDSRSWSRICASPFMYMNRLRHDDFLAAFKLAGYEIVMEQAVVSEACRHLLESSQLQPAPEFAHKSTEILATTGAWIAAAPKREDR
jgi:hypothetical protein